MYVDCFDVRGGRQLALANRQSFVSRPAGALSGLKAAPGFGLHHLACSKAYKDILCNIPLYAMRSCVSCAADLDKKVAF